ncbi:class I SAM-dependent methyltransferase [Patescibacteria group bacterium]|nr:class I SAM-dependent methyltransferase [Patescibacteria group bacterium]
MDYQNEYTNKNPNMHLKDSITKAKQISQVIPFNIKINSLLDVACGAGLVTIQIVKKLKPRYAQGVDISTAMIDKAKSLDVNKLIFWENADIFKYQPKRKFDLVICVDILEHVADDSKFLKKVASLGKYIIIKTPLEDSLFSGFLRKTKIFDTWQDTENRYGHIHHYNEKILINLIKKGNLKIKKAISVPMPKRSKLIWEFFRLLFYPIALMSMEKMVRVSGGFKILLLEKNV